MAKLSGKVAIVTGGTGGLGLATVAAFVAEGAKVVIADIVTETGTGLAQQFGDSVIFQATDVSQVDDVRQLISVAVEHFGGLHIMFNNAAISSAFHADLFSEDFADFNRVMNVNLLGVMLGTQLAAKHMAGHGGGSIVNTSATSGIDAGYGVPIYRAAKAAVQHFSKSAAIEFGQFNVRVNCIAPGNIATEMNSFAAAEQTGEQAKVWARTLADIRMAPQPLKRRGTAEDIAQAAVFLGSDLSAQVTGVVLPVDGGVTCGNNYAYGRAASELFT